MTSQQRIENFISQFFPNPGPAFWTNNFADPKQIFPMNSKPSVRRAILEWARCLFVGVTLDGDFVPPQQQWTGTFVELGKSLHPSFRNTSVEDIYRALKDLIREGFLNLAREARHILTIKPGPKFINAFGHLLCDHWNKNGQTFQITQPMNRHEYLKSTFLQWLSGLKPGSDWRGGASELKSAVWPREHIVCLSEIRKVLEAVENDRLLWFGLTGEIWREVRICIERREPAKSAWGNKWKMACLKRAILAWHHDFFVTGWLGQDKSQGTFKEFQDALKKFGAPAQYAESDFQAALCDISRDGTFDSEAFRDGPDKPWTHKIFPGQLKSLGSDECKPQTTTAQLKTAILAWHKWFFTEDYLYHANADFRRWVEVLKSFDAPSAYTSSDFEIALRQLAEEEKIPSKRTSGRVTACSEYYIFPRGTSYKKVREKDPVDSAAVIWCYDDPPAFKSEWMTSTCNSFFDTLTEQPKSTHTYSRGHGPKDRWEFTLDELFDMLKTLAPDAHFEGRNINQDGGKPVAQLWAWTPKGCVLLTEAPTS